MGDIHVFQAKPEIEKIQWFADYGAQERYPLDPAKSRREMRVDGNEARPDVSIIFPISHQQISLHCLSTDVSQARSNECDLDPAIGSALSAHTPVLASTCHHFSIERAVLASNSLHAEV